MTRLRFVYLIDNQICNLSPLQGYTWYVELSDNPICANDTDSDLMTDDYEVTYFLNPFIDDAGVDYDGDGLTNLQEFDANTHPWSSDTDGDGLSDYDEVLTHFTDP